MGSVVVPCVAVDVRSGLRHEVSCSGGLLASNAAASKLHACQARKLQPSAAPAGGMALSPPRHRADLLEATYSMLSPAATSGGDSHSDSDIIVIMSPARSAVSAASGGRGSTLRRSSVATTVKRRRVRPRLSTGAATSASFTDTTTPQSRASGAAGSSLLRSRLVLSSSDDDSDDCSSGLSTSAVVRGVPDTTVGGVRSAPAGAAFVPRAADRRGSSGDELNPRAPFTSASGACRVSLHGTTSTPASSRHSGRPSRAMPASSGHGSGSDGDNGVIVLTDSDEGDDGSFVCVSTVTSAVVRTARLAVVTAPMVPAATAPTASGIADTAPTPAAALGDGAASPAQAGPRSGGNPACDRCATWRGWV